MPNFACGYSDPNLTSIESNKKLIRNFLKSAQQILAQDGEIQITLKTSTPYNKWTFPDFAEYEIEPKSNHFFNAQLFPGYVHKSTKGHVNVNNGMAKTYAFSKKKKHQDANEIGEAGDDEFAASTSFTLMLQFIVANDDIESWLEVISLCRDANRDVLDSRRQLPEAIRPDTRHSIRSLAPASPLAIARISARLRGKANHPSESSPSSLPSKRRRRTVNLLNESSDDRRVRPRVLDSDLSSPPMCTERGLQRLAIKSRRGH